MAHYQETPLVDAADLAERLSLGKLWIKDESSRLGLPAFKMLGASWAVYRALAARLDADLEPWRDVSELADKVARLKPLTLAAATDGNHGRAVARTAALLGLDAHILVPGDMAPARIRAIEGEGATVTVVDGTYDDAVARSAEQAGETCLVVSDMSWPGYEEVPRWVIEGYSTIFYELDRQLADRGEKVPDLVAVQIGVGALAASVVTHFRRSDSKARPSVLGVEPARAACALASMKAGGVVSIPGPHDSIMSGLNCGRPSLVAWPLISSGIDAFVAVEDQLAAEAMRQLASIGVVAGETGAAGLAGLIGLLGDDAAAELRSKLGLHGGTSALILVTEGATDPKAYEKAVGRSPQSVRATGMEPT